MFDYDYDLVPKNQREKGNPFTLPYFFKDRLNVTKYNKILQTYYNYKLIDQLQKSAKEANRIVVPGTCITFQRRKKFTELGKKHLIGHSSYFVLRIVELNSAERAKLKEYVIEHNLQSRGEDK